MKLSLTIAAALAATIIAAPVDQRTFYDEERLKMFTGQLNHQPATHLHPNPAHPQSLANAPRPPTQQEARDHQHWPGAPANPHPAHPQQDQQHRQGAPANHPGPYVHPHQFQPNPHPAHAQPQHNPHTTDVQSQYGFHRFRTRVPLNEARHPQHIPVVKAFEEANELNEAARIIALEASEVEDKDGWKATAERHRVAQVHAAGQVERHKDRCVARPLRDDKIQDALDFAEHSKAAAKTTIKNARTVLSGAAASRSQPHGIPH